MNITESLDIHTLIDMCIMNCIDTDTINLPPIKI